jgi:hypothetical protein
MRILLFLLLLPFCVNAQEPEATTIIIKLTDTTKIYDKLLKLLQTEGYSIRSSDREQNVIQTNEKTVAAYMNPTISLMFSIDTCVTVTGRLYSDVGLGRAKYELIMNKGMTNSVYKNTWNEMERVAKLINGEISYKK